MSCNKFIYRSMHNSILPRLNTMCHFTFHKPRNILRTCLEFPLIVIDLVHCDRNEPSFVTVITLQRNCLATRRGAALTRARRDCLDYAPSVYIPIGVCRRQTRLHIIMTVLVSSVQRIILAFHWLVISWATVNIQSKGTLFNGIVIT